LATWLKVTDRNATIRYIDVSKRIAEVAGGVKFTVGIPNAGDWIHNPAPPVSIEGMDQNGFVPTAKVPFG